MSDSPARARRKRYLDRDSYFYVPASTSWKREKDFEASALSATASNVEPASDAQVVSQEHSESDVGPSNASNEGGAADVDAAPSTSQAENDQLIDEGDHDSEYCGSEYSYDSDDESDSGFLDVSDEDGMLHSRFAQFDDQKLPNSQVTRSGAIAAIMSFAVAHGLTWSALGDLAKLVNFLFGTDVLPKSKYLFRQLWSKETQDIVQQHYVCEKCESEMEAQGLSAHCPMCQHTDRIQTLKDRGLFFVILNMEKQLSFLLEKTKADLHENLNKLQQPDEQITDVTSAECYKRLRKARNLSKDDLTLLINTDGSPVWKSSKTSIWPLQFIVNELPPKVRFKHPILAGLWFGKKHPNMQLFLHTFVKELNGMKAIKWNHEAHTHVSKVAVLGCSVDAPARAATLNMVNFNGYFGCPWCLIPGEHTEGSMRYIIYEPPEARTSEMMVQDMKLALRFKDTINGIKGPSALVNLKGLDLVNAQSVEYMHCVLQGVSKQVTEALLSTPYSNLCFDEALTSTVAKIDARLLVIKPPHCVTRLPRPLSERSYWKASEWRHWILFYALPCLEGILHLEYWRHLSKLSEALHILLGEELSSNEIDRAELLLESFVRSCKSLYGPSFMTFNVHGLLHLANSVRSLGPLWAHSAFVFEGGNGNIVRQVSAAKGIPQQVTERIVMFQQLCQLCDSGRLTLQEQQVCKELIGYTPVQNAARVGEKLCLLGRGKVTALSCDEQRTIQLRCGIAASSALQYERFILDGQVFHSTAYTRPARSDTTFLRTTSGDYKRVEKVLALRGTDTCVILCRPVIIADVPAGVPAMPQHIKECFLSHSAVLDIVLPEEVQDSSLFIDFPVEEKMFICNIPNKIERD